MQKRKVHPLPIIENELFDDEELFWQGRPNPIRHIRNVDWFGVLFGLFFAGFGAFFIMMASNMFNQTSFTGRPMGPPPFFQIPFFIVPLIFIGVGLRQATEPIVKVIEANGTYYALTNKRALIVTQTWSKQVRSFYDENINGIQTRFHLDGTGDVIFGNRMVTKWSHQGRRSYQRQVQVEDGFLGIPDAREVEDLISQFFLDKREKTKTKNAATDDWRESPAPQASPVSTALSPQLVEQLYQLSQGKLSGQPDKRLFDMRYVTEYETGPGGMYTGIRITDKGKEILRAYGRDVD